MITLFFKTYRDHWRALLAWSLTIIGLVSIQMSVYPSIAKNSANVKQFLESYPEAIQKIFRMQDYSTGAGFLSTELYSMMIPLVLIAVGASWGASATAQEEDKATADSLFTLPISRARILFSKMLATVSAVVILAFLAMANILALRAAVDMEISARALLAGTISSIGLGLVFTSLAFFVGSFSSHKGAALGAATGAALICFVIYSLAGLVDTFNAVEPYNPMEWALGGNPLFDGIDVAGNLTLFAAALVLFFVTHLKFNRKDIHSQ